MEDRLLAEQVKQFARIAPLALAATAINATILAYILRHQVPSSTLLIWLLAAYGTVAIRLPLFYRRFLSSPDPARISRLRYWFVAATGLAGLLWGSAGLLFFPYLAREFQVFLAFILGGMAAGAAGTYSVLMPAFLAYALPALLPLMARFFLLPGEMERAMGCLILIYLGLLVPIAWRNHTTMRSNFRLQQENGLLASRQTAAWKETMRINLELQQEIEERRRTERALQESRNELEQRVAARTRELGEANRQMQVDIERRRQAEAALRETNELLERVFSTSFLKIAYMDRNFNFIRVNRAYAAADGKSPEEYLGRNHFELYPDRENEELFLQVVSTGQTISFRAKPFVRPGQTGGATTYWDWELIPLTSEAGEIQGLALFLVEVTDRIRAEEHLRQAQKLEAVGTLAGGIAHDFNNILNAILGYAELVQRDLPPGSPASARMEKVIAAGRRAAELVRQILTFSSAGHQERQPLQLQPEIEEAARLLEGMLPEGITLQLQLDPGCRPVLANPSQIHQVVMNLGANALHAMREKEGRLTIALEEIDLPLEGREKGLSPGRYARLAVADTGSGMPPEILPRIFDPYFTTKGQGEGSGMGLAIVHGIVKSHGGSIQVRSTPGGGSRFEVLLPVLQGEKSRPARAAAGRGLPRVLLVDDEEMIVELGKEMLEQLGCQVFTASNGREALEIFQREAAGIDLVITDQSMPGLTGAELSRILLEQKPELPTILITGFSELMDRRQIKAAGIREVITKPFSLAELAAPVQRLLADSRNRYG